MNLSRRSTVAIFLGRFVPSALPAAIPVAILAMVLIYIAQTVDQIQRISLDRSQAILEEAKRVEIRTKAQSVADTIAFYLDQHPELRSEDVGSLEKKQEYEELRSIAVQQVGFNGTTIVFDDRGFFRFHPDDQQVGNNLASFTQEFPEFWALFSTALPGNVVQGEYRWVNSDGAEVEKFTTIVPVRGSDLRVAAVVDLEEITRPVPRNEAGQPAGQETREAEQLVKNFKNRLSLLGLLLSLVFLMSMLWSSRWLTQPVRPLKDQRPCRVAQFGEMAEQMKEQQERLEGQVRSQTEQLARRTNQLEAAASVAQEAAGIRDLDQLLTHTVNLISNRFDYYHVGIFLLDEPGDYAVLCAANSEGGQRMLTRRHKLAVGKAGIVGMVAGTGKPRIALDVGTDLVYFNNPDLPLTRSEMALPMMVKDRIIGVLDVQSTESQAFSMEDARILRIMADQLALAIENVRLLAENQRTLEEMDRLYGQHTRRAWRERLKLQPLTFTYRAGSVGAGDGHLLPLSEGRPVIPADADHPLESQAKLFQVDGVQRMVIPIQLRGQILGSLALVRRPCRRQQTEESAATERGEPEVSTQESAEISAKPQPGSAQTPIWTEEDLDLATQIINQVGPALENARLLEESHAAAAREQIVNLITTNIRSSNNPEIIMQATVRELGRILGASRTFIHLDPAAWPPARLPDQENAGGDMA